MRSKLGTWDPSIPPKTIRASALSNAQVLPAKLCPTRCTPTAANSQCQTLFNAVADLDSCLGTPPWSSPSALQAPSTGAWTWATTTRSLWSPVTRAPTSPHVPARPCQVQLDHACQAGCIGGCVMCHVSYDHRAWGEQS